MMLTTTNKLVVLLTVFLLVVCAAAEDGGEGDEGGEAVERGWITSQLITLCEWAKTTGTFGAVVYAIFLACAIVIGAPCTVLEILPGLLFGWPTGFAVAMIGKFAGSAISVMLAKTLLKDYVLTKIIPRYKALQIMAAVVQRNGFVAVLLFRGVVVAPLAVKNYGLGAIGVATPELLAAAFITNFPYSLWWSYLGSTAKDIVDILDGKDVQGPTKQLMENPQAAAAVAMVAAVLVFVVAKKGKQEWVKAAADLSNAAERSKKNDDGDEDRDKVEDANEAAASRFDENEAERLQNEQVPKELQFNSPGRKANLSIFAEGKRKRKSPSRFVAKH